MMPFGEDLQAFPDTLSAVTIHLDLVPHWLQTAFVLVMAFFAASLLVGFFRQTITSLHTHKESL